MKLDPWTLTVCAAMFSAALWSVLLVTRVGLGEAGRGLLTWLAADVLLVPLRLMSVTDAGLMSLAISLPPMVIVSACVAASCYLRLVAVQGCLGRTRPSKEVAGVVLLLITIVGGANWLLSTQSSRSTVTSLAAIVCSILTLRELAGPGRRFWGPRLVAVAQLMCVVLNLHIMMRSGQVEQVPWAEALVIDMLFALLGTTGMLLWTQERVRNQLAQTAITDALTGALNRHGLVPYLERELAKAQRTERPVSVVLCDLDHFKAVNDVHGHDVGDAVLKLFVDRATASIRTGDVLGRWGGEEFLFVLPETAVGDAVQVAERLRQSLRRPELGLPAVTVSAGVATAARNTGYDLKTLLSVADRHLYLAKETRDRVVAQTTAKRAVQRGAESGREYAAASAS